MSQLDTGLAGFFWNNGNEYPLKLDAAHAIFGSYSNLDGWYAGNNDNFWAVMPGYKFYLCKSDNYGGDRILLDNTSSTEPHFFSMRGTDVDDKTESVAVYWKQDTVKKSINITTFWNSSNPWSSSINLPS